MVGAAGTSARDREQVDMADPPFAIPAPGSRSLIPGGPRIKSSHSGLDGCVAAQDNGDGTVTLSDTKRPDAPGLVLSIANYDQLIASVRSGAFEPPWWWRPINRMWTLKEWIRNWVRKVRSSI